MAYTKKRVFYDADTFHLAPSGAPLNAYEARNRARWLATGGREGLPLMLPGSTRSGGGVFWSRGWNLCDTCHQPSHPPDRLLPFRYVRDGVLHQGWSCAPWGGDD